MAGFGGDDVEIKVTLDARDAETQADRIRRGLEKIGQQGEKSATSISKLDKEMENFGKEVQKVSAAAKFDKFKDLDKAIKDAFSQKNILSAQQLGDKLYDIGAAAVKLGAPLDAVKNQINKIGQETQKTGSAFQSFKDNLAPIAAGFYLFQQATGYVRQLGQALQEAGKNENISRAFNSIQEAAGANPERVIQGLRSATQGLISDVDLFQKANQAVLLGLPTDGFDKMAGAAIKLGRAMGLDALSAVDSLSLGVGRQSRLILDNLGIIINAEEANQKYADSHHKLSSELTTAEQKTAFITLAYERILEKAKQLPDVTDSASTAYSKFSTALTNAENAFLSAVNNSGTLASAIKDLGDEFNSPSFISGIKAMGSALADLTGTLLKLAEVAATPITITVKGLGAVANAGAAAGDFLGEAMFGKGEVRTPATLGGPAIGASIAKQIKQDADEAKIALQGVVAEQDKLVKNALGIDELTGFSPKEVAALRKETEALFASVGTKGQASAEEVKKGLDKIREGLKPKQIEEFGKIATRALAAVEAQTKKGEAASKKAESAQKRYNEELRKASGAIDKMLGGDGISKLQEDVQKLVETSSGMEELSAGFNTLAASLIKSTGSATDLYEAFKKLGTVEKFDPTDLNPGTTPAQLFDPANAGKKVSDINKSDFGPRELFGTDRSKVFNVDIGLSEQASQDLHDSLTSIMSSALTTAFDAVLNGGEFGHQQAVDLGRALGGAAGKAGGEALGNYIGGPVGAEIGGTIGQALGTAVGQKIVDLFGGGDTAGTTARKSVDRFFADLFDANRLSVIVGDQVQRIRDLTFSGNTVFGGNSDFGDGSFSAFFESLPADAAAAFGGVGAAFEQLLGVSEEISGQIAAVLANNIGGSLENLQILVQTTGYSFEQLGDAIFESFFNGTLSIDEAYNSLAALNDLFTAGIPGALGAIDQAFNNFQTALADGRGSRILLDSLRDIGAEAQELGIKDFPSLAAALVNNFGFSTAQVAAFFEAMKASGINSITELVNASNATLLTGAENVQNFVEGKPFVGPIATPPPDFHPATNFANAYTDPGPKGSKDKKDGKSKGESAAEAAAKRAAAEAKRLQELVLRLLTASESYKQILDKLNDSQITNVDASKQIRELYDEIANKTKRLSELQERLNNALNGKAGLADAKKKVAEAQKAYNEESKKGAEADKKALADLNKALKDAKKNFDDLAKAAKDPALIGKLSSDIEKLQKGIKEITEKPAKALSSLDLTPIKTLLVDMNRLNLAATSLGVSMDKTVDIIVQGFKAGQLSIRDAANEITKTTDLLGKGIPGAVGAVDQAFGNLLKGGTKGGAFSLDAFGDIFAEAEEKFNKGANGLRSAQRDRLTGAFDTARDAFQSAADGGPDTGEGIVAYNQRLDTLRDNFIGAKKELDDFNNTIPKINLEDLRGILTDSGIDPASVQKLFTTIYDAGFTTFEDLKNASEPQIISMFKELEDLGLPFATIVDQSIPDFNAGLNSIINPLVKVGEGVNAQMVDPLKQANDIIKGILDGANLLPPVLSGPVAAGLTAVSIQIAGFVTQLQKIEEGYNVPVNLQVTSSFDNDVTKAIANGTIGDIATTVGGSTAGNPGALGNIDFAQLARRTQRLTYLINHNRRAEAQTLADKWGLDISLAL